MSGLFRRCLVLAALLVTPVVARAELLTTFTGTKPFENVSVSQFGGAYLPEPVGPFNFTVGAGSTDPNFAVGSQLRAFCADITGQVNPDTQYSFQAVSPSALPKVNGDAAKVTLIERLFNRFYGVATDGTNGGAFQLALWELLEDGPGNLDLFAGNFAVATADPNSSVPLAAQWLAGLGTADPNDTSKYTVVGLLDTTAVDGQDQLTVIPNNPVPAPAGVLLGFAALGAFGLRRWRGKGRVA